MGKVVRSSSGGGRIIRKAPPSTGRVIRKTASGRAAPAHDQIPFPPRNHWPKGRPIDKAWCGKCGNWRYYRNVRKIRQQNGDTVAIGRCIQCGTQHTFRGS